MVLRSLNCCGMQEIEGLKSWNPDRFFEMVRFPPSCAYIIFNGVKEDGYVATFRAFILKEQLGEIVDIKPLRNPNSGNVLDGGIWHIDRTSLRVWVDKQMLIRYPKPTTPPGV